MEERRCEGLGWGLEWPCRRGRGEDGGEGGGVGRRETHLRQRAQSFVDRRDRGLLARRRTLRLCLGEICGGEVRGLDPRSRRGRHCSDETAL
jgi:hypothetical protein